jgi:hypothetical protein
MIGLLRTSLSLVGTATAATGHGATTTFETAPEREDRDDDAEDDADDRRPSGWMMSGYARPPTWGERSRRQLTCNMTWPYIDPSSMEGSRSPS